MGKVSRTAIHSYIFACGHDGTTIEEVAHHFGLTPQVTADMFKSLRRDKRVVISGYTRDVGLLPGSLVWKDVSC